MKSYKQNNEEKNKSIFNGRCSICGNYNSRVCENEGPTLCYNCYCKKRISNFNHENKVLNKTETLKNKFLHEYHEANFLGKKDIAEYAMEKYRIACDYELGINPEHWSKIGISEK